MFADDFPRQRAARRAGPNGRLSRASCHFEPRKLIDSSVGVYVPAPVSSTRYCRYRDVLEIAAVPLGMLTNDDHVASGTAASPKRTLRRSVVSAGTVTTDVAEFQVTCEPPSSTRDVNVPAVAYGAKRTESIVNPLPPAL